jgi:hypothetical protein
MPVPTIYGIGGCNGASKTTFAKEFPPSVGPRFLSWSESRLNYFDGLTLILVRLEPNHHRLGFRILLQHFVTHFAAPAGLFVAAKRQSGIKYVVTIDPDCAGF